MDAAKVIEEMWARIDARDWPGVGELLAEDAVVEWPLSGERIVGRENFLSVNSEYPEGWSIRVLRIVAEGKTVVSEVDVPHEAMGVFRAVSFWTVADGRVVAGTEYWTCPGTESPPEWRARFVERIAAV